MKKIVIFTLALVLVLGLSSGFASAKNIDTDDIPEVNGTYDVPGHKNMKVRVFVHNPKVKNNILPNPTCTNDPGSESIVSSAGWHLPANWSYNLNPASVPIGISGANFASMTQDSFGRWSAASNGKVAFSKGSDVTIATKKLDKKNIVTFGKTSPSALGVTYTWYYPSTGLVAETDTILNRRFSWFWYMNGCVASAYDAQDILTHELGHWMGLNDHYTSDYSNNTMYGYGFKGDTKNITLTNGDIAGTQNIYGK